MKRSKVMALRALIEKAAVSLSDEDALEAAELFAVWASGTEYVAEQRIRYGGKLYRCVQGHTAQEGWEPDKTPALWTEVALPGGSSPPEHRTPTTRATRCITQMRTARCM